MVTVNYQPGAASLAGQLCGRPITDEELANAVGALDGATLHVRAKQLTELLVEVEHPWIESHEVGLRRALNGERYVWLYHLDKRYDAPSGVGLQVIVTMVKGARHLGFQGIELFALGNAKDKRYSGYLVWALYGFDAVLFTEERRLLWLLSHFRGVRTVNELLARGGRDWWQRNGDERKMIFELSPKSSMIQTLNNYLASKGFAERI
ncbi:MAG: hypothetical protein HOP19_04415 [Acidobacteria bacterium]|nr:hypothetical protein [Acidobacteriota bacterium]